MKKNFKAVLSLVLTLALVLCCAAPAFAADFDKTPVILIPGFGQSETRVYDDDGNYIGDVSCFDLPNLDIAGLIKTLASPLLLSAFTRQNKNLTGAVDAALRNVLKPYLLNSDGTPVYNKVVRQFDKPYSQLSPEEQEIVYSHVSLNGLEEYDDVRYYYTYDSFGSIKQAAEGLHDYIHNIVLAQTGADKIILCPISQGGTVLIQYLDMYPQDYPLIKKIVNMIPAFDGSGIVGDVMLDKVTIYDTEKLHNEILPALLPDGDTAYQISLAVRLVMSPSVQQAVLKQALSTVKDILIVNSSMMWALCPEEAYQQVKDIYLSGDEHAAVRAETDAFSKAKAAFPSHLDTLRQNGVTVHIICSYDVGYYLSYLFENGNGNADDLLAPSSPSLGAVSANIGETLGDSYVSPHTYCSDPSHNHISPDNVIDASTGYLPENTWYVKGVSHMAMNSRADIKNFAAKLIMDDSITDIYSCEGYSQFIDPKENIGSSQLDEETGRIYYYDKDGNYMYSEAAPKESENEKGISFWYLACKFLDVLERLFVIIGHIAD